MPTIEDVRQFIKENESFFKTPLKDQKRFQAFYQKVNKMDEIRHYSAGLTALLYRGCHRLSEKAETLVIYPWKNGNFEPALKHEKIRQYLMDNKDHPAVVLWRNKSLIELAERETNFNSLLNRLEPNFKYLNQQVELGNTNYISAANAAQQLSTELRAIGRLYFAQLPSPQDTTSFREQCQHSIDKAESEFKNHRGFWHKNMAPIVKEIIGLIVGLLTLPGLLSVDYRNTLRDTFFSTPKTNAAKTLDAFKVDLRNLDKYDEIVPTALNIALSMRNTL